MVFGKLARGGAAGVFLRWASRLRFPYLFALTLLLFIANLFIPDVLPLADHRVHGRVDGLAGDRQFPVDHHGPRGDQPLRLTTGADPRLGEELVNTHGSFGRHALPFEAFAPQGETIIRRRAEGLFSPSAGWSS